MTAPVARPPERGSGVVGTTFGVGVFLVLLTSAAHLLVGLWQTTSIEAVARDAAVEVATAPDDLATATAEARALTRARAALGGLSDGVDLRFEADPTGRDVVLRVRAPSLHLVPRAAAGIVGDRGLDRTIVVPRERP